jgi:bacterioferritin-associated ferredoxin
MAGLILINAGALTWPDSALQREPRLAGGVSVEQGGISRVIICSCNVLSDHQVRNLVAAPEAPRTAAQVFGGLGCDPECGRCTRTIRRVVADAVQQAAMIEP